MKEDLATVLSDLFSGIVARIEKLENAASKEPFGGVEGRLSTLEADAFVHKGEIRVLDSRQGEIVSKVNDLAGRLKALEACHGQPPSHGHRDNDPKLNYLGFWVNYQGKDEFFSFKTHYFRTRTDGSLGLGLVAGGIEVRTYPAGTWVVSST